MNENRVDLIFRRIRDGDMAELDKIYRNNREAFLNFADKYDLPKEDVIDIYQDAIIAMYDNIITGKVTGLKSSIKTYLFSIGKLMIYKQFKSNSTFRKVNLTDFKMEQIPHLRVEPSHDVIDVHQQLVNKYYNELRDRCKEILRLFYYDGLNLNEIKIRLNYDSYDVVKSQKSRCLGHLRKMILKNRK